MSEIGPRKLDGSDLTKLVGYVQARVKSPAVGDLLNRAGCLDPSPQIGKRKRLRAAIEATQERDGDASACFRLRQLADEIEAVEEERAAELRRLYQPTGGASPRTTIRTENGFRVQLGIVGHKQDLKLTLTMLPDLEGLPAVLDLEQARELYRELGIVGKEVARRTSRPNPTAR